GGAAEAARGPRTWWQDAWRRFLAQKVPVAAGVVLLILVLVAIAAPLIAPYDPIEQFRREGLSPLGQPLPPNDRFWLGTDGLGRDLLSRLIYGARISLGIGLTASALAVLIGLLVGGVAGFAGGRMDFWVMRLIDTVTSLPSFFVMLLLVVMLKPGAWVVIVVITLFSWTLPARIFRSQVLTVRHQEFIVAAQAGGVARSRIFFRHVVPHVLPLVIVYLALGIPNTIFAEASLSFIGLGVPPPAPSWGGMIQDGMAYYRAAPWTAIFPGLALMITVVCLNLVGAGLRDAMDPARKGR
ncbi:MAG TPA: ABC transporter permease, partial [Caldilineaceae bacterium]|nr:ABC transporter permease [Caldilineaceae bacterium]